MTRNHRASLAPGVVISAFLPWIAVRNTGFAASVFYHVIYALTAISMGLIALRRARLNLRAVTTDGTEGRQ